jgi:hypothetical protein
MTDAAEPAELDRLEETIDRWFSVQLAENPVVEAVERDVEGPRRWYVRVRGEERDAFTIRYHLQQRTLHYETYFMPAPMENPEELYLHLLKRNLKLYGAAFAVGDEDAIYLVGQLDNAMIDDDQLDRVLGSMYLWTEQYFHPAMRIGYASRFGG